MDNQGRFIIPAEFRKDGKAFVGSTFEETRVLQEYACSEGNRQQRRAHARQLRKQQKRTMRNAHV